MSCIRGGPVQEATAAAVTKCEKAVVVRDGVGCCDKLVWPAHWVDHKEKSRAGDK